MTDTPLLELRGVSKHFGAVHRPPRGRLQGLSRARHGARRGQRRRQVDADQVRRRHLPHRRGRDPLRGQAREHPRPARRRRASGSRSSTRTSRSPTTSTSSRTCSSGARSSSRCTRSTRPRWRRARARRSQSLSVTTIRSVRQTVAGLSGGQRQSVAVAKAVMWNSRLVILDEPTAALGVAQTRQVLDLVKRLAEQGLARDADLAQPARRLRGGRQHHRAAARPERGRVQAHRGRRRSRW